MGFFSEPREGLKGLTMKYLFICVFLIAIPAFADNRNECVECAVETNGPAAISKQIVLKALPALEVIRKSCPLAQNESTMFLSPYRTGTDQQYHTHLGFLVGRDAEMISSLTTLYSSYFVYEKNPGDPLLMVNYLAMRNEGWAKKLVESFSRAPADEFIAFNKGRYLVFLRKTRHSDSGTCLKAIRPLFESQLEKVAGPLGPEAPVEGPLNGVIFVQGMLLDTLTQLSSAQTAALSQYRDSLYAVAAGQGLSAAGSSQLAEFPNLERVSLGPTQLTFPDLQALGSLKKVRILQLGGNQIEDSMMPELAQLPKIESLSLRRNPISSQGVKSLGGLKTLMHLSLAGTKIDDDALETISSLENLRWLFLHDTAIGDPGVKLLGRLSRLEYLSLNSTKVSDESVETLAGLLNLRTLVIRDTAISEKGRLKLQSTGSKRLQIQ